MKICYFATILFVLSTKLKCALGYFIFKSDFTPNSADSASVTHSSISLKLALLPRKCEVAYAYAA